MSPLSGKLSVVFNKFAGCEVNVSEVPRSYRGKTWMEADLSPTDPAIAAIEDLAKKSGLSVRIWLPGTFGTMDVRENRLNVHIEKDADSKYRINKFTIG